MSDIQSFLEMSDFREFKSRTDLYHESGLIVVYSKNSTPVIYQSRDISDDLRYPRSKFGFNWVNPGEGKGDSIYLYLCYLQDHYKRAAIVSEFTSRFITRLPLKS